MKDFRFATSQQFHKVILRMMPSWASDKGEGRLIAGILAQAWVEGHKDLSRRFFHNENGMLERYCSVCGLNWEQVMDMYEKNCNKSYKIIKNSQVIA